ncbi:unnamed protein product, partial [Discosporangium mesarthrocarpum]
AGVNGTHGLGGRHAPVENNAGKQNNQHRGPELVQTTPRVWLCFSLISLSPRVDAPNPGAQRPHVLGLGLLGSEHNHTLGGVGTISGPTL